MTYYPIKAGLWGGHGDGELSLQLLRDSHSWLVQDEEEEGADGREVFEEARVRMEVEDVVSKTGKGY